MPDTPSDPGYEGVWSLLGGRTPQAWALAGYLLFGSALQAIWPVEGVDKSWSTAAAVAALVVTVVIMMAVPVEPLPWPATVALVAFGTVSVVVGLSAVPGRIVEPPQLWGLGSLTVVYTFLCIRGRIVAGWVGTILVGVACAVWSEQRGLGSGYGLSLAINNAGPMLMATVFSLVVAPAAAEIYALRRESADKASAEAAAAAQLAERDSQLQRFDRMTRPTLDRIAAGGPFSDAEIADFVALEAHLRDLVRAPGLVHPDLDAAVWELRRRGVGVRMHDGHALDTAGPMTRDDIRRRIIAEISGIDSGTVTVRILPRGRDRLVSVVADGDRGIRRIDFLRDGTIVEDADEVGGVAG